MYLTPVAVVYLQEGDKSLSGSIEWEDFLTMMRPVVVQEYRKDAEAILAHASPAVREVTKVRCEDSYTPLSAAARRENCSIRVCVDGWVLIVVTCG